MSRFVKIALLVCVLVILLGIVYGLAASLGSGGDYGALTWNIVAWYATFLVGYVAGNLASLVVGTVTYVLEEDLFGCKILAFIGAAIALGRNQLATAGFAVVASTMGCYLFGTLLCSAIYACAFCFPLAALSMYIKLNHPRD